MQKAAPEEFFDTKFCVEYSAKWRRTRKSADAGNTIIHTTLFLTRFFIMIRFSIVALLMIWFEMQMSTVELLIYLNSILPLIEIYQIVCARSPRVSDACLFSSPLVYFYQLTLGIKCHCTITAQ